MVRRRESYNQLVIGKCGHLCGEWPAIDRLGDPRTWVICDEGCTAEELNSPDGEILTVWPQGEPNPHEGWVQVDKKATERRRNPYAKKPGRKSKLPDPAKLF